MQNRNCKISTLWAWWINNCYLSKIKTHSRAPCRKKYADYFVNWFHSVGSSSYSLKLLSCFLPNIAELQKFIILPKVFNVISNVPHRYSILNQIASIAILCSYWLLHTRSRFINFCNLKYRYGKQRNWQKEYEQAE